MHRLTVRNKTLPPNPSSEHMESVIVLPPPEDLIRFFPIRATATEEHIVRSRKAVADIVQGRDDRLLCVVGPCSIHDTKAAMAFAELLRGARTTYGDALEIVMRVYFEKPRTTVGWKGLINDPYLDESCRIDEGLRIARQLLIDINRLDIPAAGEFLDVISPQYLGDLISWGAIGARTTESQVHRELASGVAAPVGFKNGTDGNIKIALDAIASATRGHRFLSIHKSGQVAMVKTTGNPNCHVILRGGAEPNYDAAHVTEVVATLQKNGLAPRVMIDCSHGNSRKNHNNQVHVVDDIARQVKQGSHSIFGTMIESNLVAGAQKHTPGVDDPARLVYGQSITDACVDWATTEGMLQQLADAVRIRRTLVE